MSRPPLASTAGRPSISAKTAFRDHAWGGRSSWSVLEQLIAAGALAVLPIRTAFGPGVTLGYAIAFALAPVWLTRLRGYWGASLLALLSVTCAASGIVLGEFAQVDHVVGQNGIIETTVLILGIISGVGVILWARHLMSVAAIGTWFGLGLMVNAVLSDGVLTPTNPWKFAWAIPTSILLMSLVNRREWMSRQLVAVLILAAVCALTGARSLFATLLLAAVLVAWQLRPRQQTRGSSWFWTTAMMASLGYAIYELGTALLVDGLLGEDAQAKSIAQIEQSGSLILGGRPELAASFALFMDRPFGYGTGVIPNLYDVTVAKNGMAAINYDPNNGYVENFMFGSGFELHSMLFDAWAHFGLVGIAFIVAILVVVVRSMALTISRHEGNAVFMFLSWYTLWNIFFSPLYSAVPTLMLTLGLGLRSRADDLAAAPTEDPSAVSSAPDLSTPSNVAVKTSTTRRL